MIDLQMQIPPPQKKSSSGGNYYIDLESKLSHTFVSFVLQSLQQGLLSDLDAMRIMNVSSKVFDHFQEKWEREVLV